MFGCKTVDDIRELVRIGSDEYHKQPEVVQKPTRDQIYELEFLLHAKACKRRKANNYQRFAFK
jgi:hypothetical protein